MGESDGFKGAPPGQTTLEQLALFVLDRSGSMGMDEPAISGLKKYEAVRKHVLDPDEKEGCIAKLRAGGLKEGMYVGVIAFDDKVDPPLLLPTKVVAITESMLDPDRFTPRGETAIGLALNEAHKMARDFLAQADPLVQRLVTILLMSDGRNTSGPDPVTSAAEIKNTARSVEAYGGRPEIVIAAAAYGPDADEVVLRQIATPPWPGCKYAELFKRVGTGAELRNWLVGTATALTQAQKRA
ncbi:MAG: vWA domain-containing protein [Anaerolineae bacterium]